MATKQETDPWEQAARIVEGFESGAEEHTAEVLRAAAQAIRDHAVDD